MIQNILRRISMVLILMAALGIYAFADFGPKPSVVVEFENAGDQEYYVTLVAKEDKLGGPYSRVTAEDQPETDDIAIWNRLVAYEDPDGMVFAGNVQKLTGDGAYVWGYYPPSEFRVLIYFPDTDSFVESSEILEQYAFDSYYQMDFNDLPENWNDAVAAIPVTRKYNLLWQITAFLLRLAVTVAVECLLAVLFGFKGKRQMLLVLAVNCATQLAMNLLILDESVGLFVFYVLQYALIEVGVILAEGLVYCLALPKLATPEQNRNIHPIAFAFFGNVASFSLGFLLSNWFPMLFS